MPVLKLHRVAGCFPRASSCISWSRRTHLQPGSPLPGLQASRDEAKTPFMLSPPELMIAGVKKLTDGLDASPSESVPTLLEIGCGDGQVLEHMLRQTRIRESLLAQNIRIFGIDYDQELLSRARTRLETSFGIDVAKRINISALDWGESNLSKLLKEISNSQRGPIRAYMFLDCGGVAQVAPQLLKGIGTPNSRVVSIDFPLEQLDAACVRSGDKQVRWTRQRSVTIGEMDVYWYDVES